MRFLSFFRCFLSNTGAYPDFRIEPFNPSGWIVLIPLTITGYKCYATIRIPRYSRSQDRTWNPQMISV